MKKLSLVGLLFAGLTLGASSASAVEGFYLGGQLGHFSFTGESRSNFNNSIGFGGDIGFRANPLVDLVLGVQYSTYKAIGVIASNLNLLTGTMTAEFHLGRLADFDFTIGAGPGLYFADVAGANTTKFGINFGGAADLLVDDHFKVGVGIKAHNIFATTNAFSNYWTITMRAGYMFGE